MISIVIPTYNRELILPRTLDSIASQNYVEWECIIVDDGSHDSSMDVAAQYAKIDKRFRVLSNVFHKGAQGARNTGITAAQGDWICLFDSDDIMYPNYLEKMVTAIDENTDVVVCKALIRNTNTDKLQGRLDQIFSENMHKDLLREKKYVAYDVTLIRKEKLMKIGLLDEQCPSMQEWDTHIRLSKVARYKAIDDTLCEWYSGGDDAISTSRPKHIAGRWYIYYKHRWKFRRYAYAHWLHALSNLWLEVPQRWRILLWAPELMAYIPLRKLLMK